MRNAAARPQKRPRGRPPGSRLDAHERTIRRWLSMGASRREIAAALGVCEATVGAWLKRRRRAWLAAQPNFGLSQAQEKRHA